MAHPPVLPRGARGRRRLLRRAGPARRTTRPGHRRRDRQGRARSPGDGLHPQRAACGGPATGRPRQGAGPGQRRAGQGHPGQDVRHLPVRRARPRTPASSSSPTPATTCRSWPRTARSPRCTRPACRWGCCPGRATTTRPCSCPPAPACCSTATASPRPTPPTARCSGSRGPASCWPTSRGRDGDRRLMAAPGRVHRARTGSRRTTSRWSWSSASIDEHAAHAAPAMTAFRLPSDEGGEREAIRRLEEALGRRRSGRRPAPGAVDRRR